MPLLDQITTILIHLEVLTDKEPIGIREILPVQGNKKIVNEDKLFIQIEELIDRSLEIIKEKLKMGGK